MLLGVLAVLFALGFLVWIRGNTWRSKIRLRRAENVPDGPGTPEANQATLEWAIQDQAHRLYTRAAVNGQLRPYRRSRARRLGGYAALGLVGYSLLHHDRSDGGNGFEPWDLDAGR